jgi:hypothetical protein
MLKPYLLNYLDPDKSQLHLDKLNAAFVDVDYYIFTKISYEPYLTQCKLEDRSLASAELALRSLTLATVNK